MFEIMNKAPKFSRVIYILLWFPAALRCQFDNYGQCGDNSVSYKPCTDSNQCATAQYCKDGTFCCPIDSLSADCTTVANNARTSNIVGAFIPSCEYKNGKSVYAAKQCRPEFDQCYCVTEAGLEIPNSRHSRGGFTIDCNQERYRYSTSCSDKPGTCPRGTNLNIQTGPFKRCDCDSDCGGRQKCCIINITGRCVDPIEYTTVGSFGSSQVSTFGSTSRSGKTGSCPAPSSSNSNFGQICTFSDQQCPGDQKCCSVNFGSKRCVSPLGGVGRGTGFSSIFPVPHAGQCPTVTVSSSEVHARCNADGDCFLHQKCCRTFAGLECVKSVSSGSKVAHIRVISEQLQCGDNEEATSCDNECVETCSRPQRCPNPFCQVIRPNCKCRLGFVRQYNLNSPCIPLTQCASNNLGQCPLSNTISSFGKKACTFDGECAFSDERCCTTSNNQKYCTQVINAGKCPARFDTFGTLNCSRDSDCNARDKCCPNTFNRNVCVQPLENNLVTGAISSGGCADPRKIYELNGSSCPIACNSKQSNTNCGYEAGCFCKFPYIFQDANDWRNRDSKCVQRNECSTANTNKGVCPQNMERFSCGSECPRACDNLFGQVGCVRSCAVNVCQCQSPYVHVSSINWQSSKCVLESQCYLYRSNTSTNDFDGSFGSIENQSFHAGSCPLTTDDQSSSSCNYDNDCPVDQKCCQRSYPINARRCTCPDHNAIYESCSNNRFSGSPCPKETCTIPNTSCVTSGCQTGCKCKPGYVLLDSNPGSRCVRRDQCADALTALSFGGSSSLGNVGTTNSRVVTNALQNSQVLAAVAQISSESKGFNNQAISGTIKFTQEGGAVRISGVVRGLPPGQHGFHIHQYGDISSGCSSAGPHFNPSGQVGGRIAGSLGFLNANVFGEANINVLDQEISLNNFNSIVGRTVGISNSLLGSSGTPIACGIIGIARL